MTPDDLLRAAIDLNHSVTPEEFNDLVLKFAAEQRASERALAPLFRDPGPSQPFPVHEVFADGWEVGRWHERFGLEGTAETAWRGYLAGRGWLDRTDRIERAVAADAVDEPEAAHAHPPLLVTFFRDEEADWGRKGDYEGWSTERTAIELIRHLRSSHDRA